MHPGSQTVHKGFLVRSSVQLQSQIMPSVVTAGSKYTTSIIVAFPFPSIALSGLSAANRCVALHPVLVWRIWVVRRTTASRSESFLVCLLVTPQHLVVTRWSIHPVSASIIGCPSVGRIVCVLISTLSPNPCFLWTPGNCSKSWTCWCGRNINVAVGEVLNVLVRCAGTFSWWNGTLFGIGEHCWWIRWKACVCNTCYW